jgi:hypothetical protein
MAWPRRASFVGLWLLMGMSLSASARAGAEVKLDRDFITGLVEKLPPAPFKKDNQYHGEAKAFRLIGIDPNSRRLHVRCEITGVYRPMIAQAVHQGQADKNAGGGWKSFAFDVLAAVKAEPGPDGAPRFSVEIIEVKRKALDGLPGALSMILGRYFDDLVTQVADGKAQALGDKMNAQLRKKIDAFKEYGVLREIGYAPDQLTLVFDVTKYKSDGVSGHVFATQKPGTVPLFRWSRPRFGDRYYTTTPGAIPGHPYYVFEGIACYVYPAQEPETTPLTRWRGPLEWFYTTDPLGEGMARRGYHSETIACYLFPKPAADTVPLYRFTDPRTHLHFYTTHPHAEFLK